MKVKVDFGGYEPWRAHSTDAGVDLRTPLAVTVPAHGSVIVDTRTRVELPKGCAGLLVSKSGLNVMHGITSTGLIDEGFTGTILVRLYNLSDEDYTFDEGDKVSQLVVIPVRYEPVVLVDKIAGGERGDDGYGSTGR